MRPGSGMIEWGGFGYGLGIGEWFVITLLWGLIVVGLALLIQRVWDRARSEGRFGLGTGPRGPILLQFQAQERRHKPDYEPSEDRDAAGVSPVGALRR